MSKQFLFRGVLPKAPVLLTPFFAAFVFVGFPVLATPPVGQTVVSGPFRAPVRDNVNFNQWSQNPLFNLQIQSSADNWGFDVITVDAQYAPMDANGRPSSSGWHSHPATLTMVQVLQGTVMQWEPHNPNCLTPFPAGSVWFESPGHAHNVINMDPKTPAVVRVTYILERRLTVTRTDEPDPFTGGTTVSSTPPAAACAPHVAAGAVPQRDEIAAQGPKAAGPLRTSE